MKYYSVACEAPGGLGPDAVYTYDLSGRYIEAIQYLDLEFTVWLGGELVTDVFVFCVSRALWDFLLGGGIRGVSIRPMKVTRGEHVDSAIPEFVELLIPMTAHGKKGGRWQLVNESIPPADLFSGVGLPLFATEPTKTLLETYPRTGATFQEADLM